MRQIGGSYVGKHLYSLTRYEARFGTLTEYLNPWRGIAKQRMMSMHREGRNTRKAATRCSRQHAFLNSGIARSTAKLPRTGLLSRKVTRLGPVSQPVETQWVARWMMVRIAG